MRLYTWIKSPAKYYLVMECCAEGDLLKHLNQAGMLGDGAARGFFKGMMQGLAFCHGLGLHHRDIKLENLMLSKGADGVRARVRVRARARVRVRTSCSPRAPTVSK